MSPTPLEDQVHDALHRTADPLQRAPFTVTDVRTRARRIQRRRAAWPAPRSPPSWRSPSPSALGMVGPAPRSDVPPATSRPHPGSPGPSASTRSPPDGAEPAVPLINVDDPSLTSTARPSSCPGSTTS